MRDVDLFGVASGGVLARRSSRLVIRKELAQGESLFCPMRCVQLPVRQEKRCKIVSLRVVGEPSTPKEFEVFLESHFGRHRFLFAVRVECPLELLAAIAEHDSVAALLVFERCHVTALPPPCCPDFVPTPQGKSSGLLLHFIPWENAVLD